jgi:hypothetical protein
MAVINTFDQLKNNPTNLSAVNLNNLSGDGSKFFNNFFNQTISISTAKDDAVVSYFERICDNKESALALSSAVVYTARVQNIDVMAVLDEFKKLSTEQLGPYISYFLNLSRIGTSLIGVQNTPIKNKYVARTIIA